MGACRAVALVQAVLLVLALAPDARAAPGPSAAVEGHALVSRRASAAPLGYFLLVRQDKALCAIRFRSARRNHDQNPGGVFVSGDESMEAEYEWFYEEDASRGFDPRKARSGVSKASRGPTYGIGRLILPSTSARIDCGAIERMSWNYPTLVGVADEKTRHLGRESAPTAWTDVAAIRLEDPKLVWYLNASIDAPLRIALADLPGGGAPPRPRAPKTSTDPASAAMQAAPGMELARAQAVFESSDREAMANEGFAILHRHFGRPEPWPLVDALWKLSSAEYPSLNWTMLAEPALRLRAAGLWGQWRREIHGDRAAAEVAARYARGFLGSKDPALRQEAISAVGSTGNPDDAGGLVVLAMSRDAPVALRAVGALVALERANPAMGPVTPVVYARGSEPVRARLREYEAAGLLRAPLGPTR